MRITFALLFIVAGCDAKTSRPSPSDAKSIIDAGYARPELHELRESTRDFARSENVVKWDRSYDGVAMRIDTKSARVGQAWTHRWLRELKEPDPVKHDALISAQSAAEEIGLADELSAGLASTRLVYYPVYDQAPGKLVRTAQDVELVVTEFHLAHEIANSTDGSRTYVDAYDNSVIGREASRSDLSVNVVTNNYGSVPIDITRNGVCTRRGCPDVYADPIRATNLVCTTSGAWSTCNLGPGQGIVSLSASSTVGTYAPVDASGLRNDLAFSLKSAWDYYQATFNRRGLRNLTPVPGFSGNDALIYFSPSVPGLGNMGMDASSGLIEFIPGVDADAMAALDVVGHEWSHAVFNWEVGNLDNVNYWGTNGGIQEANADLFGELIEAYGMYTVGLQFTPEIQGDWAVESGLPIRYMCNSTLGSVPSGYATWAPVLDLPQANINAHFAVGPYDRALCMLGRGMPPFGDPSAPERQSPLIPNGTGAHPSAELARLQYRVVSSLDTYPRPYIGTNIRDATLDAALEQFGLYSPMYKDVQDVFAAVLIGDPADRGLPVVSMTSGTAIKQGSVVSINVAPNALGTSIAEVTYAIDGVVYAGTTSAPWQLTPPMLPDGVHQLTVTATDIHNNVGSGTWALTFDNTSPTLFIEDSTPCWPSATTWCGSWHGKRQYTVIASDAGGVATELLYIDGPPYDSEPGAWNDFVVTYSATGDHAVQASAIDNSGNSSGRTPLQYFQVDLTPPTVSGLAFSSDPTIEGRGYLSFCATDPAFVGAFTFAANGVARAINTTLTSANCWKVQFDLPVGSYGGLLQVPDHWNNIANAAAAITLPRIAPTVSVPTVVVDSVQIGHVSVTDTYAATHGIAALVLRVCTPTGSCTTYSHWSPSNSAADQSHHTFDVTGLSAGATYYAEVEVDGANGLSTTRQSATFTIPTGHQAVIYHEEERNDDDANGNNVASNVTAIQGTWNPYYSSVFGLGGYFDQDYFNFTVPAGKSLVVSSTFACSSAVVELWRWNAFSHEWDEYVWGDANGSVELAGPTEGSATAYQIELSYETVNYPWPTATMPGCTAPDYTLQLTLY